MTTPPRDFFEQYVRPAYTAWTADPQTAWKAKATASGLHDMAEHVFHYWKNRDSSIIYSVSDVNKYRHRLVARKCGNYALVWDVAEGQKHVKLKRPSKKVTRFSQTKRETPGGFFPPSYFPPTYWGRGYWGPKPRLVVTLDDGSKRDLSTILENVFNMWKNLLRRMGL